MGKFMKKHKKKVIIIAIILAVIILFFVRLNKKAAALPMVETTILETTDLINSVSATGMVESVDTKYIFTQLTLPVENNLVEVGDVVKEGDILCELDTKTLEQNIAQQQASAGSQAAINNNSIELTQKQLEQAKADLKNDYNGTLFQAEKAVEDAQRSVERAEIAYNGTVDALQNARRDVGYSDYDDDRRGLDPLINQRDLAYNSYEAAKQAVKDAEAALEVTKNAISHEIENLEDSINSKKIASSSTSSQWIAIQHTKESIEDATIVSPISGVVTGVFVKEGGPATGLMYVVEDISHLKIQASLKEYDLSFVGEGDVVTIKSDATREEIYDGKVDNIAPTTTKNPQTGDSVAKGGEFATEIKVTSPKTGLRIGTKARMEIIYERKDNVLSVPFEALGIDAEGKPVVYVLEEEIKDTGIYLIKSIPVETGMETDYSIEISGAGLKDGDQVVAQAMTVTEGQRVQLLSKNMDVMANSLEIEAE